VHKGVLPSNALAGTLIMDCDGQWYSGEWVVRGSVGNV